MLASERTTRLSAIGRFRNERLAKRADDLEERLKGVSKAAERCSELIMETQEWVSDRRATRAETARDLRQQLTSFKNSLAEELDAFLSQTASGRKSWGDAMRNDLSAFKSTLEADVAQFIDANLNGRREATAEMRA